MVEIAIWAGHLSASQSTGSIPTEPSAQLIMPKSRSKIMVKTRAAAATEVA